MCPSYKPPYLVQARLSMICIWMILLIGQLITNKKRVMTTFHKTVFSLFHESQKVANPSYWSLRSSAAWPQLLLEGPTRSAVEHGETIDLFCSWLGKSKGHRKNKLHGCTRLKYKQSSNVFFSRQQVPCISWHLAKIFSDIKATSSLLSNNRFCTKHVNHWSRFNPFSDTFLKQKKRSRAVIRAFILSFVKVFTWSCTSLALMIKPQWPQTSVCANAVATLSHPVA